MAMDLRTVGLPVEEEDDAVELSLGLAVGGRSRKVGGYGAVPLRQDLEVGSGEAAAAGRCGSGEWMSFSSAQLPLGFWRGDLADGHDPHTRRETHAMRRQEARKRRHGKQKKKGSACGVGDGVTAGEESCGFSPSLEEETCLADDQVALEVQEKLCRVRDREVKEEEARHSERRAIDNRVRRSDFVPTPELCSIAGANPSTCSSPNPSISPKFSNTNLKPFGLAPPYPLIAMQYPYPPVQYAPMGNGLGFPYMMPCWAPMMSSSVAGGPNPASNVFQPVACRTFRPFWAPDVEPTSGVSPLLCGKPTDSSGGNGKMTEQALSRTGSLGSGSLSGVSDYQSNSLQAAGSSGGSDMISHSSRATAEISRHPPQSSNPVLQGRSGRGVSSPPVESQADAVPGNPSETARPSSNPAGSTAKEEEEEEEDDPAQSQCAAAAAADESAPAAVDGSSRRPPPFPRLMPCVSATGNGPNGRTVAGFLYRYTSSTEVRIVCVCHGSSFSAAEFVEHAGGTGVDNPLRHIVVAPS